MSRRESRRREATFPTALVTVADRAEARILEILDAEVDRWRAVDPALVGSARRAARLRRRRRQAAAARVLPLRLRRRGRRRPTIRSSSTRPPRSSWCTRSRSSTTTSWTAPTPAAGSDAVHRAVRTTARGRRVARRSPPLRRRHGDPRRRLRARLRRHADARRARRRAGRSSTSCASSCASASRSTSSAPHAARHRRRDAARRIATYKSGEVHGRAAAAPRRRARGPLRRARPHLSRDRAPARRGVPAPRRHPRRVRRHRRHGQAGRRRPARGQADAARRDRGRARRARRPRLLARLGAADLDGRRRRGAAGAVRAHRRARRTSKREIERLVDEVARAALATAAPLTDRRPARAGSTSSAGYVAWRDSVSDASPSVAITSPASRRTTARRRRSTGSTFEVGAGEVFGLLGPERRGQDDDGRDPRGLPPPDAGTVRVLGLDPVRDGARCGRGSA